MDKLTDEDLKKLAGLIRGNGWLKRTGMYDRNIPLTDTLDGDCLANAFDELLSLRTASAPGMEEVDAIEDWLEGKEIEFGVVRRIKRLVEMVGQLSAALTAERNARVLAQKQRDEIILDLNTVDRVDYLGELRHMAAYTGSEPSDAIFAARRILTICGKGDG